MPPGSHECVLDSVLRALGVTQDELGHAEQAGNDAVASCAKASWSPAVARSTSVSCIDATGSARNIRPRSIQYEPPDAPNGSRRGRIAGTNAVRHDRRQQDAARYQLASESGLWECQSGDLTPPSKTSANPTTGSVRTSTRYSPGSSATASAPTVPVVIGSSTPAILRSRPSSSAKSGQPSGIPQRARSRNEGLASRASCHGRR